MGNTAAQPPIHGTVIAYQGIGVLLLGPSGSGKSRLAMEASVLGACVVADDQVILANQSGKLVAMPVPALQGVVEMRGVGLCKMHPALSHPVQLAIELGVEAERLPEPAYITLADVTIPLLRLPSPPMTSALYLFAVMKAVQEGRILPPDWHPTA